MIVITEYSLPLNSVNSNHVNMVYYVTKDLQLYFTVPNIACILNLETDTVDRARQGFKCFLDECVLINEAGLPVYGQYFSEAGFWMITRRISENTCSSNKTKLDKLIMWIMWIGTYVFPTMRVYTTCTGRKDIDFRVYKCIKRLRCKCGLQWPKITDFLHKDNLLAMAHSYSQRCLTAINHVKEEQESSAKKDNIHFQMSMMLLRRYLDTEICWSDIVYDLLKYFNDNCANSNELTASVTIMQEEKTADRNSFMTTNDEAPLDLTGKHLNHLAQQVVTDIVLPLRDSTTTAASMSAPTATNTTTAFASVSFPTPSTSQHMHTAPPCSTIPSKVYRANTFHTLLYHLPVSNNTCYIRFFVSKYASASDDVQRFQKNTGMKLYGNEYIRTDYHPRLVLKTVVNHFSRFGMSRFGKHLNTYTLQGLNVSDVWDFLKSQFGQCRKIVFL